MRTVQISDIISMARLKTDTVYSNAVTDTELLKLLANHYRNLYNVMTTKDESLFINENAITITAGSYTLPTDLYKVLSVFIRRSDFDYPLERVGYQSRGTGGGTINWPTWILHKNTIKFTPSDGMSDLYISYLPLPVDLAAKATGAIGNGTNEPTITFTAVTPGSSGNSISVTLTSGGTAGSEAVSLSDSAISVQIESGVSTVAQVKTALDYSLAADLITTAATYAGALSTNTVTLSGAYETIDLVCNEDEYLINCLCVDIAKREESDTVIFERDKQQALGQVISFLAPRDSGNPVKVRDVESEREYKQIFPRGVRRW